MQLRLRPIDDRTAVTYHRRIRLVGTPGEVQGDVADGPHHFRVWIAHDGERVTDVRGESVRHPWTTCPAAAGQLQALVGMPLGGSSTAVGEHAVATLQCTHMFDLAGLVVAHAPRGIATRNYHCRVVEDRDGVDHVQCIVRDEPGAGDAERTIAWRVREGRILGPAPFEDVPLQRRFSRWAESQLDAETAEAAIVMRRAWFVSPVRFVDVDQWERASELGNGPVCHTFQPERAETALHRDGTYVDCGDDPERLLGAPNEDDG